MSGKVTLEEAERIAIQLSPYDQLKLIAWICENLSKLMLFPTDEEKQRKNMLNE